MIRDTIKPDAIYNLASQGQGPQTTAKQYALEKVLGQWLGIVANIKKNANSPASKYDIKMREIAQKPILYVDMNAGSGWNEKVDCIGSPLLFLDEFAAHNMDADINFIELKPERATALYHRIFDDHIACIGKPCTRLLPMCNVRTGDNHEIVSTILKTCGKRYGLIYCDPDGAENIRFDQLATISRMPNCRFIDLLIRISGTGWKRAKNGLNGIGKKRDNFSHCIGKYPNLQSAVGCIQKRKWFVRDVRQPDPQQWTFLFGTNWMGYNPMVHEGFYDINSPKGKEIYDLIAYTPDELKEMGRCQ